MEEYNEVEHLIKKLEINKRAKYGDNLIKEWSKKLIVYVTN